ncbi:MAG: MYXO-CTERM sorting domain-containing protein [Polyangiaceae bacterium]
MSVNPSVRTALIQGATSGSTSTTPLPTPDFNAGFNMSLSDGKVALVFGAPLNGCGAAGNACPTASIVDLVGYGSASQFEGSAAAPALSIQNSGARKQHGCQDTDQNANDFTAAAPTPKNTSSPLNNCALQDGGTGGTGGTGGATGGTGGATGGTGGATGGTGGATGGTGGATGGAAGSAGTAGAAGAATGGSGGSGGAGGTTGGSGGTTGGSGGTKFDAGVGGSAGIGSSGDDGGCGCSVPGERSLPKGTALFALLGSALFARRRSSRR